MCRGIEDRWLGSSAPGLSVKVEDRLVPYDVGLKNTTFKVR